MERYLENPYKKLLKHSVVYGFGNVATKIISFLLLPFYVKHLSPSDYGVLEICNVMHSILLIIVMLGMASSMFKVYYEEKLLINRKIITGSIISFYTIFSILFLFVIYLMKSFLTKNFMDFHNGGYLLDILLLSVFIEGFLTYGLTILRAENRSLSYSIVTLFRIVCYAILNIIILSVFHRGYTGVREVVLFSVLLSTILIIFFIKKYVKLSLNKEYLKEVLYLGIPLAIGGLALWVLNMTDRVMLKMILPEDIAMSEVGLYSFGAKFAQILRFLLVLPFTLSWGALMFSYQDHPDAKKIYSRVLDIFMFIGSIIMLGLVFFSKDLITKLSSENDYTGAIIIVPILTYSSLLAGTYMIFTVGPTLARKTSYISYSNLIAAVLNVIMNYFIIPVYGIIGASFASLIANFIRNMLLYIWGQKIYKIEFKIWRNIALLIFITIFIAFFSKYDASILIRSLTFILLVFLLPLFKTIDHTTILKLIKKLKNRL